MGVAVLGVVDWGEIDCGYYMLCECNFSLKNNNSNSYLSLHMDFRVD